jgi:glycosyltransferase involved in cell wall biosynthesis
LASELKLNSHVSFLGYRSDASQLIYDFDIFVHPSRWEGFGLVFLEAMAAGVPIIATRTSAIPEIVEDGETGLLVPVDDEDALSDALSLLLADPPLRKQMGMAGRRRLDEHFSVQKMVERTAQIYQHI